MTLLLLDSKDGIVDDLPKEKFEVFNLMAKKIYKNYPDKFDEKMDEPQAAVALLMKFLVNFDQFIDESYLELIKDAIKDS